MTVKELLSVTQGDGYLISYSGNEYIIYSRTTKEIVHLYYAQLPDEETPYIQKKLNCGYIGYVIPVIGRILLTDSDDALSNTLIQAVLGEAYGQAILYMEQVIGDIYKDSILYYEKGKKKAAADGVLYTYDYRATLKCYCKYGTNRERLWDFFDLKSTMPPCTISEQVAFVMGGGLDISAYKDRCSLEMFAQRILVEYKKICERFDMINTNPDNPITVFRNMRVAIPSPKDTITVLIDVSGDYIQLHLKTNPFEDELASNVPLWNHKLRLCFSIKKNNVDYSNLKIDFSKDNAIVFIHISQILAISQYGTYYYIKSGVTNLPD